MKHVPEHASLSVSVPAGGCGWLPYWDGCAAETGPEYRALKLEKKNK